MNFHLAKPVKPLVAMAVALLAVAGPVVAAPSDVAPAQTVIITSSSLAGQVRSAVNEAVGQRSPDITVAERDGLVSLGGFAFVAADLHAAMRVAGSVEGVRRVTDDGVRLWSSRTFDYY